MKSTKFLGIAMASALTMAAAMPAAASECGLSCCIAAGVEGVGSSTGVTLSLQYDSMDMKTIKQGTTELTPAQARLADGGMPDAVPTKMVMQKYAVNVSYRHDENNAFVLTVPYLINDMDMLNPAGMPMTMDTISGMGDVSLVYLHDLYKDSDFRTRQRFSVGVGVKAPTGNSKSRNATTGRLIHMMMQAGTGSWDGLFLANGTLAFGEHDDGGAQWLLSPSLIYHMTTKNDLGYKVGNRLNYDLSARYRITSEFNVKLDLNGVISNRDSTDGTIDSSGLVAYQNPMSIIDKVQNTGLHSIFVSPGFQWVVTPKFIVSGEYRVPVYQKANGVQQVTDNWFFLRATTRF